MPSCIASTSTAPHPANDARAQRRLCSSRDPCHQGRVGQLEASPANPQRLHQLDGLRAIAAALVVLHHAGSASLAQKLADHGHAFAANALTGLTGAGVELFFVLSGVVLLRPYARQRRGFDLALYIRRRIERLWPPYLVVWLLAGACIWLTTYHPSEWTRTANLTSFSF